MPRKKHDQKSEGALVTDPRFAKVHTDARFRSIPKKEKSTAVDERFTRMFKDENFKVTSLKDVRGRKKASALKEDLQKFYHIESASESESESEDAEEAAVMESPGSTDESSGDEALYEEESESAESIPETTVDTRRLALIDFDWEHLKACLCVLERASSHVDTRPWTCLYCCIRLCLWVARSSL
jgi:hypothetical protein